MREIIKTVYQFEELSDTAKERAREWWRNVETEDFDHECVFDDAVRMGALLGIEISTHTVKLMGGSTRQDPDISFSGFGSQGDGASFQGRYAYKKGAPKAIKAETSAGRDDASKGDRELLRIAETLQELQRTAFYSLTARMGRGHNANYYSHPGTMSVDIERSDERETTPAQEGIITGCMRDFADWIYRRLENEWEYRMSDESVDESIRINEYEFDEEGNRA